MMLKGSFMIPQTSTWLPRKQYTAIRNEAFIQKKRMKEWEQKCIKKEVFFGDGAAPTTPVSTK